MFKKLNWTILIVLALSSLYFLYADAEAVRTGIPNPRAFALSIIVGRGVGFYLWYVLVPMFVFKRIRWLFSKVISTASVDAQPQLDLAEDMTG